MFFFCVIEEIYNFASKSRDVPATTELFQDTQKDSVFASVVAERVNRNLFEEVIEI